MIAISSRATPGVRSGRCNQTAVTICPASFRIISPGMQVPGPFDGGPFDGRAYDIGELVTYLNDGVMIAPTMLLVPEVRWSEVDTSSFDVSIADRGRAVRARVFVDERGAPVNFETTDRFYSDPKDATEVIRCRWTTPIAGWQDVGDRRLPTSGLAVWHPPNEDELAYADFRFFPETLAFNVAPGS
jgi:hypothetical protein